MLVTRPIHVVYHLKVAAEHQGTVLRVHGFHAEYYPVARTIGGSMDITTALVMEEP